jgi:hypothetical protein
MAISAEDVFKETMSADLIRASDARAEELLNEWCSIRAELPAVVQERLNAKRQARLHLNSEITRNTDD